MTPTLKAILLIQVKNISLLQNPRPFLIALINAPNVYGEDIIDSTVSSTSAYIVENEDRVTTWPTVFILVEPRSLNYSGG